MLIGRHHGLLPRLMFRLMVWISVIALPVLVLLAAQVRFLPYHDAATTTAHRVILLVDLLLAVGEPARGRSRDEQGENEAADDSSSHGGPGFRAEETSLAAR